MEIKKIYCEIIKCIKVCWYKKVDVISETGTIHYSISNPAFKKHAPLLVHLWQHRNAVLLMETLCHESGFWLCYQTTHAAHSLCRRHQRTSYINLDLSFSATHRPNVILWTDQVYVFGLCENERCLTLCHALFLCRILAITRSIPVWNNALLLTQQAGKIIFSSFQGT